MPDYIKISELPSASSIAATDQIELNQSGTSRRGTITQLNAAPGNVALYSEALGTGSVNNLTVGFPAAAKYVELVWYLALTPSTNAAISFRGSATPGSPITGSIYNMLSMGHTTASVTGDSQILQASWALISGIATAGRVVFSFLTSPSVLGTGHHWSVNSSNTRYNYTFSVDSDGMTGITGFYFSTGGGNFNSASYVRCFAAT